MNNRTPSIPTLPLPADIVSHEKRQSWGHSFHGSPETTHSGPSQKPPQMSPQKTGTLLVGPWEQTCPLPKWKRRHWPARDLITIGIFATVVKISTLAVTLIFGNMTPLTLLVKNVLFTSLLVALLHKVPRFGTLTLFIGVSTIASLLLMGNGAVLLPASLVAGLLCELIILAFGGYRRATSILLGVAVYALASKGLSLGFSWLTMRGQTDLSANACIIMSLGCVGTMIGLGCGHLLVKELRHAGIIHT